MCHVCGFIWYLCVQFKSKISTRSLSNQTLKSAHRSLLRSRCWPWEVFSPWLASHDLGTARSSYLARVGPMCLTLLDEALSFTTEPWRWNNFRITGLPLGNPQVVGEFPSQMAGFPHSWSFVSFHERPVMWNLGAFYAVNPRTTVDQKASSSDLKCRDAHVPSL